MARFPRVRKGTEEENLNEAGAVEVLAVEVEISRAPPERVCRRPSPLSLQTDHLENRAGNVSARRGLLSFATALSGNTVPRVWGPGDDAPWK